MALPSLALPSLAFTLGAVTFLSPCAYPLLPGYVSYYLGTGDGAAGSASASPSAAAPARTVPGVVVRGLPLPGGVADRLARGLVVGGVVSVGFFVVYGLLAGVVAVVGSHVLRDVAVLELVVGGTLVALGLPMAAGYRVPTVDVRLPERRRGVVGYFAFGVLYAAAAAGCSAPLFVGVALRSFAAGPVVAAATLAAYALGMSVLMVAVTAAAALGRDVLLRWLNAHVGGVRRVGGVLLVAAGLAEVYLFLFRFGGLELLGLA